MPSTALRLTQKLSELWGIENLGNQQHGIGAGNAGLEQLIAIKDEILRSTGGSTARRIADR